MRQCARGHRPGESSARARACANVSGEAGRPEQQQRPDVVTVDIPRREIQGHLAQRVSSLARTCGARRNVHAHRTRRHRCTARLRMRMQHAAARGSTRQHAAERSRTRQRMQHAAAYAARGGARQCELRRNTSRRAQRDGEVFERVARLGRNAAETAAWAFKGLPASAPTMDRKRS
jgi:hypothetical protein